MRVASKHERHVPLLTLPASGRTHRTVRPEVTKLDRSSSVCRGQQDSRGASSLLRKAEVRFTAAGHVRSQTMLAGRSELAKSCSCVGVGIAGRSLPVAVADPRSMAKDLCQDLLELSGFLQGQRQVMNDAAFDVACSSPAENVKRRIDGLRSLETKDGTELLKAVNGLPFQAPVKQDISEAVNQVLLRAPTPKGSHRPLQECSTFGSFLTKKDREILGDVETMDVDKLDRLAIRAISVGLVYPSEQTFGHLVAVGLAAGLQGRNHQEFMEHVIKLKAKLKHKREPFKFDPYDRSFPASPKQLPARIFEKAYGEDELAEEIPVGVMRQLMNDVGALRKNHKKIKGPSPALVPSSSASSQNPMEQGFRMMHMMFDYMRQQHEEQGSGGVHFTFPEKKKAKTSKALPAPGGSEPERNPPHLALGDESSQPAQVPPAPASAKQDMAPKSLEHTEGAGVSEGKRPLLALPDVSPAEQAKWLAEEKPGKPAKAKAKPGTAAKAKAKEAGTDAKPKVKEMKKPASVASVIKRPASGGWTLEEWYRPSGQCDKYFFSPSGERFRLRHEAEAAGYKD